MTVKELVSKLHFSMFFDIDDIGYVDVSDIEPEVANKEVKVFGSGHDGVIWIYTLRDSD